MSSERINQSRSQNFPTSRNNLRAAPRQFTRSQPQRPKTQEEIDHEDFQLHKFEAFGLQLKEKDGTITLSEQQRLGVLQAKMDSLWAQRMEKASLQPNLLSILLRNAHSTQTTAPAAPVQPKLTIGQPNDQYEQEADRVAQEVTSRPHPLIQRQGSSPEKEQEQNEENLVQTKPLTFRITSLVQRSPLSEEEQPVQAQSIPSIERETLVKEQVQAKCEACENEEQVQRSSDGVGQIPKIQRVATWAAGTVHQTNNLADSIINGTPVGVTWPKLNGSIFWSTAEARAAIARPTLAFSSASGGGVEAEVATVPTNTGSFDETVLAPGPWRLSTPKTTIGAMFTTLTMCAGTGNSTFRAIGDPSDGHMFTANRRHEDHHATDHQAAFNGSILAWDRRLTAAKAAGRKFTGPTEADAEAALYAAMGGTPDQVADAFFNACQASVITFHGGAAGGPVGAPTDPRASADCSTSSAKYHNPS